MDRRKYKRAISIEKARDWLRRVEENDETPPQIAKTDFVDVRTVRKQINRAREERETRESKQAVLKEAMQRHYSDLVLFAKKLEKSLLKDTPVSLSAELKSTPLLRALKEHLPRARLWKDIDGLPEQEVKYNQSIKKLKHRIINTVKNKTSLEFVEVPGKFGLYDVFGDALSSYN